MKPLLAALPALALVALLTSAPSVSAQANPLTVAQRLLEANNRNDFEAFFALLTDDHVQVGGGCGDAPGGFCAGKEAIRRHFEGAPEEEGAPTLTIIGTAQVSGNTVTARVEGRLDPAPEPFGEAGVERLIATLTLVARGDTAAFVRFELDTSDAQTAAAAQLFAAFAAEQGQVAPSEPETVVRATFAAFNLGNVDAVMALVADDVVLRQGPLPDGSFKTETRRQAVRASVQRAVAEQIQFEVSDFQVDGDQVRFTNRWTSDALRARGVDVLIASSEVVLRGGKIASSTDTLTSESVAKLRAALAGVGAPAAAPAPAQVPRLR